MPKYSRSHERAECAKISRGLWESLFGLLFCWLPGVGLILSVAGFCRQAVRLTEKYRTRRFIAMAFASVVLVGSIGVLVGEAYQYSRDPDFVSKAGLWVWRSVTGQDALPGSGEVVAVDEDDMPLEAVPDEYYTDGGTEEGDVPVGDEQMEEGDLPTSGDEQMEEGDVPVDGQQMEEGDVPVGDEQMEEGDVAAPEGDFQDDVDFSEDDCDEMGGSPEQTIPPLSDLLKSHGVTVG